MPRRKTVRPKWTLTVDQSTALAAQLPWLLPRTLVGLAFAHGSAAWRGVRVRWCDVDEPNRNVRVRAAVYEGVFDDPKTLASRRTIPLPNTALHLLEAWKTRARRTAASDLIFSTVSGKPISPNNVLRRWIWPACQTADLPRVTWLTFRRTCSSWAHEKGVPGKVVAELMGHAKVDTTLNVYTQVIDGSKRAAAAQVGNGLFAIVRRPDGKPELTH
jgi:integrase